MSDAILLPLFFGSVAVGVGLGVLLGDPTEWKDTTPTWLVLTAGCVGAAYLLVAAWKDELDDRETVEFMMRLVKLGAPGVALGATLVSAGWTVSNGGEPRLTGLVVAMFAVVLGVLMTLAAVARAIIKRQRQTSPAEVADGAAETSEH